MTKTRFFLLSCYHKKYFLCGNTITGILKYVDNHNVQDLSNYFSTAKLVGRWLPTQVRISQKSVNKRKRDRYHVQHFIIGHKCRRGTVIWAERCGTGYALGREERVFVQHYAWLYLYNSYLYFYCVFFKLFMCVDSCIRNDKYDKMYYCTLPPFYLCVVK